MLRRHRQLANAMLSRIYEIQYQFFKISKPERDVSLTHKLEVSFHHQIQITSNS